MGTGKKKIEIKQIIKEASRMVTFSKRRKGLFKKASELESMTGSRVAIVVFSPAGKLYTCGDVSSAIDAHLPQFQKTEIGSSGSSSFPSNNGVCDCGNLNVSVDIDTQFPQFHSSEIGEDGLSSFRSKNGICNCANLNVCAAIDTQIGSSGSRYFDSKNGLWDWLENIKAEECGNLNELLLLKEQLEGTRDKLAEHSEPFEAFFM